MRTLITVLATLTIGAASAQVTLDYWLWDANQLAPYQQCVDEFTAANPGISVRVTQTGWGDYWTAITTGFVAGTAPDVFTNHLAKYPEFAENEQLVNIQPLLERDGVDLGVYIDGLGELWTRDGARFGLPKDWDTIAVVYNVAMLEAAGVSVEELNSATWNPVDGGTFGDIIRRLTLDANGNDATSDAFDRSRVAQYGFSLPGTGVGDAYGQTEWSHFAVSNGFAFNDGLYATSYFYDDPRLAETLQWFADLNLVHGVAPAFSDIASLGGSSLFTAGQLAMLTDGSWMVGFYSGSSPFEVGFARLPIGPEGRKSMFNGLADSIWVGTRHPEESWQLLRHLASPDCQRIVGAAGVVFPAVPDAVDIAMNVFAERGLDVSAYTEQALEEGGTFLFPITDFGSEIASIMNNAITSIFLGQQDAETALTRANAEVNGLFR